MSTASPTSSPSAAWLGSARSPELRGLASNIAQALSVRALCTVLSIVTSIALARVLGPSGRGLYAVALALAATGVQLAALGLHSANAYFVARDRDLLPRILGNSLVMGMAVGILAAAMTWLSVLVWPEAGFARGIAAHPWVLGAALLSIPAGLTLLFARHILLGLEDIRGFNRVWLAQSLVSFALLAALLASSLVTVATAVVVALLVSLVGTVLAVRRTLARCPGRPRPCLTTLRAMFAYGIQAHVAGFLAYFLEVVDLFMVNALLGAEDAGYYATALALSGLLYMLPSAVGNVTFPRLSATASFVEKWGTTVRVGLAMAAALAVLVIVAVPLLPTGISLVLGESYLPATRVCALIAVLAIPEALAELFALLLASMALQRFTIAVWLVAHGVNAALNVLWIPVHGAAGAALASLVTVGLVAAALIGYASAVVGRGAQSR